MRGAGQEVFLRSNLSCIGWFSDLISGIVDIKLWNLHDAKTSEYEKQIDHINEASKNASLFSAKNNRIMQMTELAFINLIYLPGAILIGKAQITLGSLMKFITFSSYLLVPFDAIMQLWIVLKQIKPCIEDIQHFFALEEENYTSSLFPESIISKIEFKDVSVSFRNRIILQNINFEIYKGEKVVLVGENGSGKTTILNLLLGLYQPSSGEIRIDSISIQEYNIASYRKNFSAVLQDVHLFDGTVKENIILNGESLYHPDWFPKYCVKAVGKLENQFDTAVGSEGDKLSGGEKQKVALLRALNRKTNILALDEASANYDKESEKEFQRFIKNNKEYDFYFIVTHKKELLEYADKIIYLSHGKITQIKQISKPDACQPN